METQTQYKVTLSPNVQKNLKCTRDAIDAAANAENVSFLDAFKLCVEMLRATWTLSEDTLTVAKEKHIFLERVEKMTKEVKSAECEILLALNDLRRQTNRAPEQ